MIKSVDEINKEHKTIITEKTNDTIKNWNAVQETLYLMSILNMRESIIEGVNTNIKDCQTKLEW